MLKDYLQIHTLTLVILGKFNPTIIQPFWLVSKNLIREQEGKNAKIEIIHPQLVRFDLDWVFIEVTEDRFVLKTSKEPFFNPTKDLMESIFSYLPETPIRAMGINHLLHYNIPNEDLYYQIGDRLAPLSNWTDLQKEPRLLELSVMSKKRDDGLPGQFTAKVQPSNELSTRTGLLLSLNDHLALHPQESEREGIIVRRAGEAWEGSFKRAEAIPSKLWENLTK